MMRFSTVLRTMVATCAADRSSACAGSVAVTTTAIIAAPNNLFIARPLERSTHRVHVNCHKTPATVNARLNPMVNQRSAAASGSITTNGNHSLRESNHQHFDLVG